MGLFEQNSGSALPVWFMRQAGRYHKHYQGIRKQHNFMEMCKNPELAIEITMGPIRDFDFDAAILFSDLLFPLEYMGMGLSYDTGKPTLAWHLDSVEKIKELSTFESDRAKDFLNFQKLALQGLRQELAKEKTLLGFVGAPFTLYTYAAEGAHAGRLISAKKGLRDGRFQGFFEQLKPLLLENLKLQAEGGADALCLFDTASGELDFRDFNQYALSAAKEVIQEFKKSYPDKKIIYYSRGTHLGMLELIDTHDIDVLGVDWRTPIDQALTKLGPRFYVQGNLDPVHLFLPWSELETILDHFWSSTAICRELTSKWIFGLGHGVLPQTPEDNVKRVVEYVREKMIRP